MHTACPGCSSFRSRSAVSRVDHSRKLSLRVLWSTAYTRRTHADSSWQQAGPSCRCHQHARPAARRNFSVNSKPSAAWTKHSSRSALHAFKYDLFNPAQTSSKPLDVCKRWLQQTFPILRNEELVSRTAWTLMVIAIARLGQQLRLPYVDAAMLPQTGALNTVEMLMGGAIHNPYNVFMLGIGPMINASLLATVFVSFAEKGSWGSRAQAFVYPWKNTGSEGVAQFQGFVNKTALGFAIMSGANQGLRLLPSAAVNPNIPFLTLITVMLVAGAAVLRWLAHSNETRGLGDGTTVLIALSIVTNYAGVLKRISEGLAIGVVTQSSLVRIGAGYMGLVFLAVLISSLSLRYQLIYYKQRRSKAPEASVKKRQAAAEALGSKGGTPSSAYLPLRLSPNGMAAVLYASCVYSLPELFGWISKPAQIWMTRFLLQGRWFPLLYGLVIFGCGLIQVGDATPKNMSSYLNAVEAGVQGVSPGPSTEKFLTRKMRAVRVWGAFSVAVLAVFAQFFDTYCGSKLGVSISSLSLLLLVGLITSGTRQVQSLMQLPRLEKALQRERIVLQRMSSVKSP